MGVVIGIDVGGSTTKIIGVENKSIQSPMFVKATDPVTSQMCIRASYKVAREFAGLTGNEMVYDLYTGTGTIANFVSRQAKKVIGIEYVPEAIEDAKVNSSLNKIENTLFYACLLYTSTTIEQIYMVCAQDTFDIFCVFRFHFTFFIRQLIQFVGFLEIR